MFHTFYNLINHQQKRLKSQVESIKRHTKQFAQQPFFKFFCQLLRMENKYQYQLRSKKLMYHCSQCITFPVDYFFSFFLLMATPISCNYRHKKNAKFHPMMGKSCIRIYRLYIIRRYNYKPFKNSYIFFKHKQGMSPLIVNFTTTPVLFSIVAWLYFNNSLHLENVFLDC